MRIEYLENILYEKFTEKQIRKNPVYLQHVNIYILI